MKNEIFQYRIRGRPIARVNPVRKGKIYFDPQSKLKRELQKNYELTCANLRCIDFPIVVNFQFSFIPKGKYRSKMDKKPDLSNLIKFYEDCFNGIIWEDDKLIWNYANSCKIYDSYEYTQIRVYHEA